MIVVARAVQVQKGLGKKGYSFEIVGLCHIKVPGCQPGQNSHNIAIDTGERKIEGNASDCCTGVGTDAFQAVNVVLLGGEDPLEICLNLFGSLVQVLSPSIVTKTLPGF